MIGPYLSLAGVRATSVLLLVPNQGVWVADVTFDGNTELPTGKITLAIGAATFGGTVDPKFSGTFQLRRRVRLVGGANTWPTDIPAKHFHNDAGVRASLVLADTASAVGETLALSQDDPRLGVDYVRAAGPAGRTLRRLASRWHVDYAGVTQVGPRVVPALGKFDLLNFDTCNNVAEIAAEDPAAVPIGGVITTRLDTPLTVRELRIDVKADGARIWAWGTT